MERTPKNWSLSSSEATVGSTSEPDLPQDQSTKSLPIGIHPPSKFNPSQTDFNFDKYANKSLNEIYLDPRPRIRNIVKELQEEHQWAWPPQPPKDFQKARLTKRKKCAALYTKECLDLSTILSLIIGPWELLVALGFIIIPKTFIPAMRESSEFCILFASIFLIEGFFHTYAAILGLGLRSMRPYMIGFSFPSWPFEFVLPFLGLFVLFVSFYTTQRWRILREMTSHLKGYNFRWYSKSHWDRYQNFMHCCGIENYTDWKYHAPLLEDDTGTILTVPNSCCIEEDCWKNATETNVHSMGCIHVTMMATNTIFISGTACMLIALVLSVIGYRSLREAEDFVGDPCHNLLFHGHSTNSLNKSNMALRREELFSLVTYYTVLLGEELGFTQEVTAVKDHLGLVNDENEVGSKAQKFPSTKNQEDDTTSDNKEIKVLEPWGGDNNDDLRPVFVIDDMSPGGQTPDFLFETDTGPQGSKTDFDQAQFVPESHEQVGGSEQSQEKSEESPEKSEESQEKSEENQEKSEESQEKSEENEQLEVNSDKQEESNENPYKKEELIEKSETSPETEVLLPKQESLLLSPSAIEFALPPEKGNLVKPEDSAYFIPDPSHSVVNLIPEIPSEVTNVKVLEPYVQSEGPPPAASTTESRVALPQSPKPSEQPSRQHLGEQDAEATSEDD